jgi:hypothetical protein
MERMSMTDQPPSPREVLADELRGGYRAADKLLEALRSRGYVVVPREPTEAMIAAFDGAHGEMAYHERGYHDGDSGWIEWMSDAASVAWRAMIDAANGGGKG